MSEKSWESLTTKEHRILLGTLDDDTLSKRFARSREFFVGVRAFFNSVRWGGTDRDDDDLRLRDDDDLRLTRDESAVLTACAMRAGMTVSEYLARLVHEAIEEAE